MKIWLAFFVLEAVAVSFIDKPVQPQIVRNLLGLALQPGFDIAVFLDTKVYNSCGFPKHYCFAVSSQQFWFVSLVTLAINCVAMYLVLFCIDWLVKRRQSRRI
jgi:hypothetical protein